MTGDLSREELEGLKERGWRQVAAIDAALERGEIADDDWQSSDLARSSTSAVRTAT